MKLLIQGNNITVTEAIHDYVEEKVERAVKHFQNLTTKVDVHLSVARNARITNKHKAEVTVYANGTVIRAQEGSENLYASIDLVADKIARQLRKYKERIQDKQHGNVKTSEIVEDKPVEENLIGDRAPELPSEVLRMKYFAMPPWPLKTLWNSYSWWTMTFICSVTRTQMKSTSSTFVTMAAMALFNPTKPAS